METQWKQKVARKNEQKILDDKPSQHIQKTKLSMTPNVTKAQNGNTLETKKSQKKCQNYDCVFCDYSTSKKSDYEKHIATRKHKSCDFYGVMETCRKKVAVCNCGKTFATRSGFWKHDKKCEAGWKELDNKMVTETPDAIEKMTKMVLDVVKQNQEFKEVIMEQNKQWMEISKSYKNNTITNNNQTVNNRFSLNFFLNERCKDALNISDFINSLQISMEDIEQVGATGFVEGISRIFLKGLKQLDVCKRPIHCTDLKREVMHVKENNVWEKENDNKAKIIEAIKTIADKNIKTIPEWKLVNPDCRDSASKKSDQYLQIVGQALGACNKEKDQENYEKIIKRVAKEVMIDKLA